MTFDEDARAVVKASLELKRRVLAMALLGYRERLTEIEGKAGMTSDEFALRFDAGDLGDDPAWFKWEFLLDACREAERQLHLLDSVQL